MKKRGQKKGQLTIFIIVGLILLVTASIVVYVMTREVVKPVEEEIIVPEDVKPVYDFVSECVKDVARNGVNLLGLQGGYVYLPARIARTPTSYVPLDEKAFFKLPFWYYEGEDRTPSISFMENELKKYVTENLRACAGSFEPFQDRMSVVEEGNISASVIITDEDVVARINWPLAIIIGDTRLRVEDFVTRLPVRLKQVWELANKTMVYENKYGRFENETINLMSADASIPLDGVEFACTPTKWTIPEVRKRLQRLLYYNIPSFRIENTGYVPFQQPKRVYESLSKESDRLYKDWLRGEYEIPEKEPPSDAYEYSHFLIDVGIPPTDLKAGFEYQPEWGMLLSAQPNTGGVLKPARLKGAGRFLRFLCVQQYHFTYDIIYPIKMSVRDDKAFGGTGFLFQFAFPVIINDNAPEREFFGLRRFEVVDYETQFCQDLGNELVDVRAKGFVEGLPFAVELKNAEVLFRCVTETCLLGNTTADGGVYRLNTYLPRSCSNPWIIARKPGYLSAQKQYSGNGRIDLVMKKLQPFNVSVVVHPYYAPTKQWISPRAMGKNEQITIHAELVNTTFAQTTGGPTNQTVLELVQESAYYNIDAILTFKGEQIGGFTAQNLLIPYEDFVGKTEMVLHVPAYAPLPTTDEQKIEMTSLVLGQEYVERLKPEFK